MARISTKLLGLSISSILLLALSTYFPIKSQEAAFIRQVKEQGDLLAQVIKNSTRQDMLLNQRSRIHKIIDDIGRQKGIEQVRIFNKNGKIIYSSEKMLIGRMVDKKEEACYSCHAADKPLEHLSITKRVRIFKNPCGGRSLGIINPIYNEPACSSAACHAHPKEKRVLGVLDVVMSLRRVDETLLKNKLQILYSTAGTIVIISLIFWYFFKKFVTYPIHKLVTATRAVAEGDLSYRIECRRNDELKQLADAFNEMTRKLSESKEKLYQSDKLASVGRLAAGVAHEINNPLTGVLTYSSFLLKHGNLPEEARKDLEVVVRETKRCRGIVKSLLDFSRQYSPKMAPVDLNEVVENSLSIMDSILKLKRIKVTKDLSKEPPIVLGDSNRLQQVLINLLSNAADAVEEGKGEIVISTGSLAKEGETFHRLVIRDNGCGIPKENLDKIFEPFFSTKGNKGVGLGLSIVWGIIGEHGGRVDVESEPGEGTAFFIYFPGYKPSRPG